MSESRNAKGKSDAPESAIRLLNDACKRITQPGCRPVPAGKERELHQRLLDELEEHVAIKEGRLADHGYGWTRRPGGIDVVATKLSLGIEVKLSKPEELLLDAIKIGQRVEPDTSWNSGLRTAAIVVQIDTKQLKSPAAYMLWPTAARTFDLGAVLNEQRKDWYWLMCGGRGVRPEHLPRALRASKTLILEYRDSPGTVLAVRTFHVPKSDTGRRLTLDGHGWPKRTKVPDAWRDQIDRCSKRTPPVEFARDIPMRHKPRGEQEVQIKHIKLLKDEATHSWVFVWSPGFEKPTSFRLSPEDPSRYDLRVSSNRAVTSPGAPKPLPGWCRTYVHQLL